MQYKMIKFDKQSFSLLPAPTRYICIVYAKYLVTGSSWYPRVCTILKYTNETPIKKQSVNNWLS